MLGLFMVLPVLGTYGLLLKNSTKLLVGLSIGIYSFSQVVFQIPFGYFSDKFGRKKVILFGLLLFLIGSVIAGTIKSIWGIFIGRMLQGSGAISSSLMALLYDSIDNKNHVFSMICLGVTFVVTFILSLVISPIIVSNIGFQGLFWIISLLTCISIVLVILFVSDSTMIFYQKKKKIFFFKSLSVIFGNNDLLKLLYIVFLTNYILMANFVVLPEILLNLKFSEQGSYKVYLITTVISIIITSFVFYCIRLKNVKHIVFLISINVLLLSQIILFFIAYNFILCFLGIQLFFISFFVISSVLSTEINKLKLVNYRGFILGIYNTQQFLGMALGSSVSGGINSVFKIKYVFLVNIFLILIYHFVFFTKKHFKIIFRNIVIVYTLLMKAIYLKIY